MKPNRGMQYALRRLSNEDLTEPLNVEIDPNNPETLAGMSLSEYAALVKTETGVAYTEPSGQVATESFSDKWQNFKNRFEGDMKNEDAYVDNLLERFKTLKSQIQGANNGVRDAVPISIHANTHWLQVGSKVMQNAGNLTQEVTRLLEVNRMIDKDYLPSFAGEIKYVMEFLALGCTDVPKAVAKAYVTNKVNPNSAFDKLINKRTTIKSGNGKTHEGFESEPFLGSWLFKRWQLEDRLKLGVDRGEELFCSTVDSRTMNFVQLKAANRNDLMKLVDVCIQTLTIMNDYMDRTLRAERSMMVDKLHAFESNHANWHKYPDKERGEVLTVLLAADNCIDRGDVLMYVLNGSRKAIRTIERYIELNIKRLE